MEKGNRFFSFSSLPGRMASFIIQRPAVLPEWQLTLQLSGEDKEIYG
jgi:hypothetical protein